MSTPSKVERQLTMDQAAAQLGVNPETIKRAIRKGELRATRNTLEVGGPLYVTQSDLEAWRASRIK